MGQIKMGFDKARLDLKGLPVGADCFVHPVLAAHQISQIEPHAGFAIIELQRTAVLGFGFLEVPHGPEHLAQVGACSGMIGVAAQDLTVSIGGLVEPSRLMHGNRGTERVVGRYRYPGPVYVVTSHDLQPSNDLPRGPRDYSD